jgi:hypothetical protein
MRYLQLNKRCFEIFEVANKLATSMKDNIKLPSCLLPIFIAFDTREEYVNLNVTSNKCLKIMNVRVKFNNKS